MNRARVAALLRELADELEREDVPTPANDVRPRRRRARPAIVVPEDATDLDMKRAIDVARRRGIVIR